MNEAYDVFALFTSALFVQGLLEQQGALLSGRKAAFSAVREEEERLVSLKAELSTHREGDLILNINAIYYLPFILIPSLLKANFCFKL